MSVYRDLGVSAVNPLDTDDRAPLPGTQQGLQRRPRIVSASTR
jgi:hypothetical protein